MVPGMHLLSVWINNTFVYLQSKCMHSILLKLCNVPGLTGLEIVKDNQRAVQLKSSYLTASTATTTLPR